MAFVVLYDACVLHPAPLRDLLLRIAGTGIVRARWTERILDECIASILERRPDLSRNNLERTRARIIEAVPDCLVSKYEDLESGLDLPDPSDQHVLAAAIRAGAQAIVTFNLRDFPDHVLERYDIEPKHPDEFVLDSLDLAPAAVARCVTEQSASLHNPPMSVADLIDNLANQQQLIRSMVRLRDVLHL